jgi:biotin transport system substrate-specific component
VALVIERRGALLRELLLLLAGSLVVALSAQTRIDLPFTPVPITLQTAAAVLVGATLGARRGVAALIAYLAEGLAGLPVFAGGASGLAYALGPTGGYLLGFVLSAFVVGWLVERGWGADPLRALAAFALGGAAVYAVGVPWLALSRGLPLEVAVGAGLLPFLPGDLVKTVGAAALWSAGLRVSGRGPSRDPG